MKVDSTKILKTIEKSGQNPQDVITLLKFVEVGVDMIEVALETYKGILAKANLYEKEDKKNINRVLDTVRAYTRKFINSCGDKTKAVFQYGNLSEALYDKCIEMIESGKYEDEE